MTQRANILLVGGVLALALFGAAAAGPLEDGQAAYQRGDYAEAVRLSIRWPNKGTPPRRATSARCILKV